MKTFWEYFDTDNTQYPKDHEIVDNIMPHNTTYEYISSTFINGICNYLEPFFVMGIERYRPWDTLNLQNYVNDIKKSIHTDYWKFPDDVLILARGGNYFWFIWSDRDVSDCFIGKYERKGAREVTLIKKLIEGIEENRDPATKPTDNFETITGKWIELPLPKGWWRI